MFGLFRVRVMQSQRETHYVEIWRLEYKLLWVHVCTVCILPFHALHQRNLVWRGGDVEGGGFALMDSSLNAIHGLLFLHLDCVTEAQRTEKQLLSLLMRHTHTHASTEILHTKLLLHS